MTPSGSLIYYHRLAIGELVSAKNSYAAQSARTARRFTAAVAEAVRRIQVAPSAGMLFRTPYRWVKLHRFPYLLYYGPIGPGIYEIYAAAHERRRPGYWIGRVAKP